MQSSDQPEKHQFLPHIIIINEVERSHAAKSKHIILQPETNYFCLRL
jgi:hypothetical protein